MHAEKRSCVHLRWHALQRTKTIAASIGLHVCHARTAAAYDTNASIIVAKLAAFMRNASHNAIVACHGRWCPFCARASFCSSRHKQCYLQLRHTTWAMCATKRHCRCGRYWLMQQLQLMHAFSALYEPGTNQPPSAGLLDTSLMVLPPAAQLS